MSKQVEEVLSQVEAKTRDIGNALDEVVAANQWLRSSLDELKDNISDYEDVLLKSSVLRNLLLETEELFKFTDETMPASELMYSKLVELNSGVISSERRAVSHYGE